MIGKTVGNRYKVLEFVGRGGAGAPAAGRPAYRTRKSAGLTSQLILPLRRGGRDSTSGKGKRNGPPVEPVSFSEFVYPSQRLINSDSA